MTMETRHLLLPTTQGGPWAQDPGSVKPDYTVHSSSSNNNNNKHLKSQMISSPASVTKGTKLEALSSKFPWGLSGLLSTFILEINVFILNESLLFLLLIDGTNLFGGLRFK